MFTKSTNVVNTAILIIDRFAFTNEEVESQSIMNCEASSDDIKFVNFKSIGTFSSIAKLKRIKTVIHFKQNFGTISVGIKMGKASLLTN